MVRIEWVLSHSRRAWLKRLVRGQRLERRGVQRPVWSFWNKRLERDVGLEWSVWTERLERRVCLVRELWSERLERRVCLVREFWAERLERCVGMVWIERLER